MRLRCAEALRELRARERKLGITPDSDLDGYLKAAAVHGQSSSAVTLLVMRLLGLEVRPSHPCFFCGAAARRCCMLLLTFQSWLVGLRVNGSAQL